MGEEIRDRRFDRHDFSEFARRLRHETALLTEHETEGGLSEDAFRAGFELEAWLVDDAGTPSASNGPFLEALSGALVVPELSRFNVELNGTALALQGRALGALERELEQTWARCRAAARSLDVNLMMIGILPTVEPELLTLANMSNMTRYRALNEQVLQLRGGEPLRLDIAGRDRLETVHGDVMLEAAATSLQIHLQVPASRIVRYYNAALIASAPMVAACANSPYLFGRDLWCESRIPLFEQAIDVGARQHKRVTFGSGYLARSPLEYFRENLDVYPVLLPMLTDDPPGSLHHLRLHNGTIWRWNRLLAGFEDGGTVHLRLEHRPVPAGPTPRDCIANAACFYGLAHYLATRAGAPEGRLAFDVARRNFYAAARTGLDARLHWLDGTEAGARELLLEELLPRAGEGLADLGVDAGDAERCLSVIRVRVDSGQSGATWQRRWVARHGHDMPGLTRAYLANQEGGAPVHEWEV